MSKEVKVIVIRDNFWLGIVGDIFMYGLILFVIWFNYHYLGNNGITNFVLLAMVVVSVTNKFAINLRKEFYSWEDAITYLKEKATKL